MNDPTIVQAAGAVVWREAARDGSGGADGEVDVLLVHRPRYDDWSFPKGKLDPGEHALVAAVREVAEETGLDVRLGLPLPQQQYPSASGVTKQVQYWAARPVGDGDVRAYEPNSEVDQVAWVRVDQARERLTYARDVDVLDAFAVGAFSATPLVVLRHARAHARATWEGEDRERPLVSEGEQQARDLAPLLRAYGVGRVLSSDAVRCISTVEPFARAAGLRVEVDHGVSEEGADSADVARRVSRLLCEDVPLVACSHRPVLPAIFRALDLPDPALRPGAFVAVHRQGHDVRATEHHEV